MQFSSRRVTSDGLNFTICHFVQFLNAPIQSCDPDILQDVTAKAKFVKEMVPKMTFKSYDLIYAFLQKGRRASYEAFSLFVFKKHASIILTWPPVAIPAKISIS